MYTPSRNSIRKGKSRLASPENRFDFPITYAESEPFSKPHTVTVLALLVFSFIYALNYQKFDNSFEGNLSRGVLAALALGLVFCTEYLRDTLFVRPHPAVWRWVTGLGLFYAMALAFSLFQDLETLRSILAYLDPKHGGKVPLDKSYGENCELTYENLRGSVDEFVIAHLMGWAFKAVMMRDIRLSMILSFLFEIMEYTFTFIQPNFNECWWDHWIMDFLLCNTGGIIIGHLLMSFFDSREYNWVGIKDLPTVKSKIGRVLNQFTPYSWTRYEWRITEDFKRFLYVNAIIVGTMICELDAFFLKFILNLQSASPLNVYRLFLWWGVGMVALRDLYAFVTNPQIKRIGSTGWVMLAILIMEFAVVIKFGYTLPAWQGKKMPAGIMYGWIAFLTFYILFTIYWYGIRVPPSKAHNVTQKEIVNKFSKIESPEKKTPSKSKSSPTKSKKSPSRGRSTTPRNRAGSIKQK